MTMNPMQAGLIAGAGADANPADRPGVPMENDPPHLIGSAHWGQPIRQPDPGYVLKRRGLDRLTPVFGTSVPPRGVSGLMRRFAYLIPEHRTTHWLMLLLADRVDVAEHRATRSLPFVLTAVIGGGALLLAASRVRRSPFQRLLCRLAG